MKAIHPEQTDLKTLSKALFWFALVILFGNLLLVVFGSITNYDSLTCHVARLQYYLQFGKVWYYGANYWAQDIHPTNLTYIQILFYKIFGGWENSVLLIQYLSLLVISFLIHQISLQIYPSKWIAKLSALLIFLFVNPVVQSATSQNDLFLTLVFTTQIFICVRPLALNKKLFFLGLIFIFGLGVKQTFILYQPAIVIIFLYFNKLNSIRIGKNSIGLFLIFLLISPLMLSYMFSNYINLGSIHGFKDIINHHSILNNGFGFVLKAGIRNLFRYFFDFITLDGLNTYPPLSLYIAKVNNLFKYEMNQVFSLFLGDLETGPEIRLGFYCLKPLSVEDSSSFWGPIGPLLVIPAVFFFAIQSFKTKSLGIEIVLCISLITCVLAQAFSSYYDMWRGRYFNELVPITCIFLASFIAQNWHSRRIRTYIVFVLILSAFATFGATYLRRERTILFNRIPNSVFTQSRDELITSNNPEYLKILAFMKTLNPACDSIGLYTTENMPEYLLFGKGEERKLFPLNSCERTSPWKNLRMDAILFTDNVLPTDKADIKLGVFGVNGEVLYYRENEIR